jgi:hypothetical protein
MSNESATPSEETGARRSPALVGLINVLPTHGSTPDDEPMAALPDRFDASEEQLRRCQEAGSVVVGRVQTVGPTAKERERRRLSRQKHRLSRETPTDRCRPAGRARPRERRDGRRHSGSRSSSRGGDSGDDGESEPPAGGRLCQCGCQQDISHRAAQARYLNDQHAAADRQRRKRERDEVNPNRVVERRLERLTVGDQPRKCRCSTEGVDKDPEGAWICVACGRPRTVALTAVNSYDARLAEVRGWMRNERAESRQVRRHRLPREWRTRPRRKLSAKLRTTRTTRNIEEAAA